MKKFYEYMNYRDDDLEEEDEIDSLDWTIIGWTDKPFNSNDFETGQYRNYKMFWDMDDWIYILQEEINDNKIILYNNQDFDILNVYKHYTPLSNEELEKYIYSNKKRICVYNRNVHQFVFYKDLPEDVKNKLSR
jgi:hypothetical protein